MLVRIAAVFVLLLSAACAPATAAPVAADTAEPTEATLVAAYPNPVESGDPGEFVVVRFDGETNVSGWTLTDGKTTASLPNRTVAGTVALSTAPGDARAHTDRPVARLSGRLLLADDGDRLVLRSPDGRTQSTARYRNAPESELRDFEAGAWRPLGATDRDPIRTAGGEATAFVLPDAAGLAAEEIAAADERVLLGGYTFTSERVAEALRRAAERGATVRVLLDGAPVGGISRRQTRLLDSLAESGVEVRLLAGPHRRYRYHHAKYAVVDDRALVTTENFKPAGTGGMSSRGWGVVLDDPEAVAEIAAIHAADRGWRAATPWAKYRTARTFGDPDPAVGSFESRHDPERVAVESTTVLTAPDNAAGELEAAIDAADERVLVQQVRIDSREHPLLRATLAAAARGVRVRIHLSGSWYVAENNRALVEWLNRRAEREGWDLKARIDEPDGYGKIHTKGVVVDDTAVVGSLNWVESAGRENRELLVALESPAAADYYAEVFADDWGRGTDRPLPAGLLAAVAVAGSGGLLLARRIEFVGREGVVSGWRS